MGVVMERWCSAQSVLGVLLNREKLMSEKEYTDKDRQCAIPLQPGDGQGPSPEAFAKIKRIVGSIEKKKKAGRRKWWIIGSLGVVLLGGAGLAVYIDHETKRNMPSGMFEKHWIETVTNEIELDKTLQGCFARTFEYNIKPIEIPAYMETCMMAQGYRYWHGAGLASTYDENKTCDQIQKEFPLDKSCYYKPDIEMEAYERWKKFKEENAQRQ
jgi:hypothetical protein